MINKHEKLEKWKVKHTGPWLVSMWRWLIRLCGQTKAVLWGVHSMF